jgi:hydrogenase maturation protease
MKFEELIRTIEDFIRKSACNVKIACFGSPIHGDDAVGWIVYNTLKNVYNIPADFMGNDTWRIVSLVLQGYSVIAVDAVYLSGSKPGSIILTQIKEANFESDIAVTSHTSSISNVVLETGIDPEKVLLVGVAVNTQHVGLMKKPSKEVVESSKILAQLIYEAFKNVCDG